MTNSKAVPEHLARIIRQADEYAAVYAAVCAALDGPLGTVRSTELVDELVRAARAGHTRDPYTGAPEQMEDGS